MAQQYNAESEAARIRDRIRQIEGQVRREQDFLEFGATHDHEYQMSHVRIEALTMEKNKLKKILGDLPR